MAVSDRDRRVFARIGRYKAASHRETAEAHRALPLTERLRRSVELSHRFRPPEPKPFDDGPLELYARARRLGLHDDHPRGR